MGKGKTLHFSLFLFIHVFIFSFGKKSIETDESSLLALKSSIILNSNPGAESILSNWTEGTSVCTWTGVRCSTLHDRVVALNISFLGLQGTIPPHIGNLSFLYSIDLSNNYFQGEIPDEIAKLRRLKHINLCFNNIGGEIPGWFGFLSELRMVNLANNSFSGSIPRSFFNATKMESLYLSYNQLSGKIPEELGNLVNLRILDLQMNNLGGYLPLSIFNLSSLQILVLTNNTINGDLPPDICSKLPNLAEMYLSKNSFSGQLQSRFKHCSRLQFLSLSYNYFTGQIPREIGNLTTLVRFYGGHNEFQGQIPAEISNLPRLSVLSLGFNNLSGSIPPSIFNISSLSQLLLIFNSLTGSLPLKIDQQLPNLQSLSLGENNLSGGIPSSISNITKLSDLLLEDNRFTGPIPTTLGNLRSLELFSVFRNFLTDSDFLESLTNCRNLTEINTSGNPLNMSLPRSIGNFSSSLLKFVMSSCGIRGNIPPRIRGLAGLIMFSLYDNHLSGQLPSAIQNLSNLQSLDLGLNQITGFIPRSLCNIRPLSGLYMGRNRFFGQIPECFGSMTSLRYVSLRGNRLNYTLPNEIGFLKDLLILDVHSNFLSGNITPIGGLNSAVYIDLSENNFSGNLPSTIGGLKKLVNLSVARNQIEGPIPESFQNMLSLEILNLSRNNLSGEIPATLGMLSRLKGFDVSYNLLRGRVPTNGSFLNFSIDSFVSNDALCGGALALHFPPCIDGNPRTKSRRQRLRLVAYILTPIAALVIVISAILFVFLRNQKAKNVAQVEFAHFSRLQRVSFYDIQRATNGFNESNLLGKGCFGRVYKAVLSNQDILAIKVFNLELEGAFKSFETECEVLRNIRHRNLVKIISSCSNLDFKALVLEYMPNGSLERWLYSHNHFLNFLQRLNIMIDVASALEYLHLGYTSPIVHCDLKPSNVLVDEDMIGHVSDFGISKLLGEGESMVQTMTLATVGYTAPEYGSEGMVSTSCDICSFGILLMETFTRRKPTDVMFEEGWGLRELIMDGLRSSAHDFIDQNLLDIEDRSSDHAINCIVSVMKLAVRCAMNLPEQRINANDVFVELQKIKLLFMSSRT